MQQAALDSRRKIHSVHHIAQAAARCVFIIPIFFGVFPEIILIAQKLHEIVVCLVKHLYDGARLPVFVRSVNPGKQRFGKISPIAVAEAAYRIDLTLFEIAAILLQPPFEHLPVVSENRNRLDDLLYHFAVFPDIHDPRKIVMRFQL